MMTNYTIAQLEIGIAEYEDLNAALVELHREMIASLAGEALLGKLFTRIDLTRQLLEAHRENEDLRRQVADSKAK